MPTYAPVFMLKSLVNSSREKLRKAVAETVENQPTVYTDGMKIGQSHTIILATGSKRSARRKDQLLHWTILPADDYRDKQNQDVIRKLVRKALDEQAKAYLPRRLQYLSESGQFRYSQVRFSNAKGRWGSCSSGGVISLNVALMNLPKELIDYVLCHELCHTVHMNHSVKFWMLVESIYPTYKQARKQLKLYSPHL